MNPLRLHGGPKGGTVIDLDHVCNGDNTNCPAHGWRFNHSGGQPIKIESHSYSAVTGQYEGQTDV